MASTITEIYQSRLPGLGYNMSFKVVFSDGGDSFTLDEAAIIQNPSGSSHVVYGDSALGKIYWDNSAKRFKGKSFTANSTLACEVGGELAT